MLCIYIQCISIYIYTLCCNYIPILHSIPSYSYAQVHASMTCSKESKKGGSVTKLTDINANISIMLLALIHKVST